RGRVRSAVFRNATADLARLARAEKARGPGVRIDTQVDELVAEVRTRECHVPAERAAIDQLNGRLHFVAPTLGRADVLQGAELRGRGRRRDRDGDERISRLLVPVRVVEVD